MKKELKEGMGFICETLEDKKRIWQKLSAAGYPMFNEGNDNEFKHIYWVDKMWVETSFGNITIPLNESDFFDEVAEWTPQAGELVNYGNNGVWYPVPHVFVIEWKGFYYLENKFDGLLFRATHIKQIKPETMTLQEVREALGKPNLIIKNK
jgi:hypothetical protein